MQPKPLLSPVSKKQDALGRLGERLLTLVFPDLVLYDDPFDQNGDGYHRITLRIFEVKVQDPLYIEGGVTLSLRKETNFHKCMAADDLYFVVYQSNRSHPRGKANWDKVIIYRVIHRENYHESERIYFESGKRLKEKVIVYEWDNLEIVKEIYDPKLADLFRKHSGSQFLLPN